MLVKEAIQLLEIIDDETHLEKSLVKYRFSKLGLYNYDSSFEEHKIDLPNDVQNVLSEILSDNLDVAWEMWISSFDEVLEKQDFSNLTNIIQMYELIQQIKISKVSAENKSKVFCHLSIIGLWKALWNGFISVIPGLFNWFIATKQKMPLIVEMMETIEKTIFQAGTIKLPFEKIRSEEINLSELEDYTSLYGFKFANDYNSTLFNSLMISISELQVSRSKVFDRPDDYSFLLSGSNVPSKIIKSKKKTSAISGYYIRGQPFILEDGKTWINGNEALEWDLIYTQHSLLTH